MAEWIEEALRAGVLIPILTVFIVPVFSKALGLDLRSRLNAERRAIATDSETLKNIAEYRDEDSAELKVVETKFKEDLSTSSERYFKLKEIAEKKFGFWDAIGSFRENIAVAFFVVLYVLSIVMTVFGVIISPVFAYLRSDPDDYWLMAAVFFGGAVSLYVIYTLVERLLRHFYRVHLFNKVARGEE
ncbi:MAG: hypothetical protein AAFN27_02195 [Pseudomonadota bacterium]